MSMILGDKNYWTMQSKDMVAYRWSEFCEVSFVCGVGNL